ncbi:MAG: hypothetical protein ACLPKB_03985 [Xanthobacteraceae bacterium]
MKKGLRRPRLSAIILSSRLRAFILIAAPFSSRLSRYTEDTQQGHEKPHRDIFGMSAVLNTTDLRIA